MKLNLNKLNNRMKKIVFLVLAGMLLSQKLPLVAEVFSAKDF